MGLGYAFARHFSPTPPGPAIKAYREAFTEGKDLHVINGDEKPKDLLARYKAFQSDDGGPMVVLVQSDKNKGWSGHDTTGKTQRVLINLAPADLLKEGFWIRVDGMVRARITPGCEYVPPKEVGFHEYPTSPQYERWLPVWINCMPTGYKETHRLPPEPHPHLPRARRTRRSSALRERCLGCHSRQARARHPRR